MRALVLVALLFPLSASAPGEGPVMRRSGHVESWCGEVCRDLPSLGTEPKVRRKAQ